MKWIHQHIDFGLGNFINVTPIIKWLYKITGEPVDVYFDTDFVREAYEGHPMINVLETKPDTEPMCTSNYRCQDNNMEDFKFAFEDCTNEKYTENYKPFVHCESTLKWRHAVIICGSGVETEEYLNSKIPGESYYSAIVALLQSKGIPCFFIGSENDINRFKYMDNYFDGRFIDDIETSIQVMKESEIVIGNDTGLIHAAGTFDKKTFIMWKDTPFPRCKNSGLNATYSMKGNWLEDFKTFLNEI